MKNKFIATILTITLMASMTLVGCGSSAAPTGAGTQASSAATQESTADSASAADTTTSGEKTVIEYWHCNADTQGGTTVEELVNKFHRVEWRAVGGNPACRGYDNFIKRHNGNKHILKDCIRDRNGNYHDDIIYEIVKKEVTK